MRPAARTADTDLAHWSLLPAIVLGATVLRAAAIGRESLWTDEALTIVIANWSWSDLLWRPVDPTPPLYYALHKLFLPPGAGVVAMRSLSLVAGVLVVPVGYVAGRLSIGRAGGLLVAALLAASAPLVDHSVEARAYSLLVLTVLLSATGLIGWLVERERDGGGSPRRRRLALALFA